MTKLGKKVMRRVYYTFMVRFFTHPAFLHFAILATSFFLLTRVVSVPDIWRNLMAVPVGEVFLFLFNALLNTQLLTLVLLSIITITFLSLFSRLFKDKHFEVEGEWARG